MEPPAAKALEYINAEKDAALNSLVKKDPRLLLYRDQHDMTLLHRAAQRGAYNSIQVLLKCGADPYATLPRSEWSPIHLAARDTADFAIVKVYVEFGIDIRGVDASGRNILHICCMHGNLEFCAQLIELNLIDLSEANLALDSKGWTALHYAAWHGNCSCVELLLKGQANSLLTDKDGYSPLHLACESAALVPIKLLAADIKPKLSASGWAEILTECVAIVRAKNDAALVAFLKRYEADAHSSADPFPLHQAVKNADLAKVKQILNAGLCKINEKNAQGQTATHLAAQLGLEETVAFLIEQGANLDITVRGTQLTACDLARRHHQYKCARLLGMEVAENDAEQVDFIC